MLDPQQQEDIRQLIISTLVNYSDIMRIQSGNIQSGNFATGVSGWKLDAAGNLEANNGNFRGDISGATGVFVGAAATAAKLATPRTIAGVSFDGSANIAIAHTGLTSIGTNTHAQIDNALSPLFDSSGNQRNTPHLVENSVALSSGVATVTLSGSSVYTSSTSYTVHVTRSANTNSVKVVNNSGSSFTITSSNLADGDTVRYIIIGN